MTNQRIIVDNLQHLWALQNHEPGEIAYIKDTQEMMAWDEEKGWVKIDANVDEKSGIELNLYDINKNIISQLKPLTSEQIAEQVQMLDHYYNTSKNLHHMLLCKDFNYYTIFDLNVASPVPSFKDAVCEIITKLGDVYSLELLEDGAIEIWIKPVGEENPYAFYLFPYDAGVVYYG